MTTICVLAQGDYVCASQLQVRHGVAADQGRRGHMEDATTAILDFRDNLTEEVAAQAPDIISFYGVLTVAELAFSSHDYIWCCCWPYRYRTIHTDPVRCPAGL